MATIKYFIYTGIVAIFPYMKLLFLILTVLIGTLYVFYILVANEFKRVLKEEEEEEENNRIAELASKTENPDVSNA